jgi:ATP-dependent protease ClpP protease subunit
MRLLRSLAVFFVLLFPSCAHATEPISNAENLADFVLELNGTPAPTAARCPEWLKLDDSIGGSMVETLTEQLEACKDRAVVVEINSPGGNLFAALEIQKAIERHPKPVLCLVDGLAASAAFVTLQSCDVRAMTPRSILMAHHASFNGARGQSHELENAVAALRAIDRATALFVAKRLDMKADDYEAKVSGGREWWLALDEAEKVHAIDFEVDDVVEALTLARAL